MSAPADAGPGELIWEGSPTWRSHYGYTILCCLLVPLVIGIILLLVQWAKLSAIRYRLTSKRIEWETGIFSKKIDGIDVWRIRHVEFFQSFGDRLGKVSRLHLYVQDKEEPEIIIRGLPGGRDVYDKVAAAAQLSRRGTLGLVQ
ncbi:MAG TPA: PH domain-containing protein [Polyangia bacterium]|nr:PH domain-containing protein [Polyangia bacterium]